jgi:hypothetical protein
MKLFFSSYHICLLLFSSVSIYFPTFLHSSRVHFDLWIEICITTICGDYGDTDAL